MRKLLFALTLLLSSSPSFASFLGANSAIGTSSNGSVTVSGTGFTGATMILLEIQSCGGTGFTITWPTGFSLLTSADDDGAHNGGPCELVIGWGTTVASSYLITIAGGSSTNPIAIAAAWSETSSSAPTNYAATNEIVAGASPVSIPLTGVTALAGDDIAWFGSVNYATAGTWVFTAPTSYTSQQTIQQTGTYTGAANLSTRDGVSAGATGVITGTATDSGQAVDAFGVVVSLPSSGGAPTQKGGMFFGDARGPKISDKALAMLPPVGAHGCLTVTHSRRGMCAVN